VNKNKDDSFYSVEEVSEDEKTDLEFEQPVESKQKETNSTSVYDRILACRT